MPHLMPSGLTLTSSQWELPSVDMWIWHTCAYFSQRAFRKHNFIFIHQLHQKLNHCMQPSKTAGWHKTLQTRLWLTIMSFPGRHSSSNLSSWRTLSWSKAGIGENIKHVSFPCHRSEINHMRFQYKINMSTRSSRETGEQEDKTARPLKLML